MPNRRVSMETTIYRGPDDNESEIDIEVQGSLEPYSAGTYYDPPEGGGVEDVQATFWDESAKKRRDIPLTDDEISSFSEQMAEDACDDEPDYPDYDD